MCKFVKAQQTLLKLSKFNSCILFSKTGCCGVGGCEEGVGTIGCFLGALVVVEGR